MAAESAMSLMTPALPILLFLSGKYLKYVVPVIAAAYATVAFFYSGNPNTPMFIMKAIHSWEYVLAFLVGILFYSFEKNIVRYKYYITLTFAVLFLLSIQYGSLQFYSIVLFPFAVLCFALTKSFLNKISRDADYTYGIYIYSFPVQQTIIQMSSNRVDPYLLFVITLAIVFPVAYFSWHFMEKRILGYKSYFVAKKK